MGLGEKGQVTEGRTFSSNEETGGWGVNVEQGDQGRN